MENKVELIFEDVNEFQFNVKSNEKEYLVSINEDGIKCNVCEDWQYRWKRAAEVGGSFMCSHCYAAMFKLADMLKVKPASLESGTELGVIE